MSWYRQQLEDWLKTLDIKGDVVLDIGGSQGPVNSRLNSLHCRRYKILDLPAFDLEGKWNPSNIPRADVIFCLEVFEYLIQPLKALKRISNIMKNNSKAYITFAFVYPYHNEAELDSLRYTENGIRRLAESAGLKISNIWYRTDRSGLIQTMYATDGMHPIKGYEHHNATGFIVEFQK